MAIVGVKKKNIDRDFIFKHILPFDIFRYYYPYSFELNKHCINPFVQSDVNPSMKIGNKSDTGEIIFKCWNSNNKGDCFNFVMQLYGCTYHEALDKIAVDFGLVEGSIIDYKKIINSYEHPISVVKPSIIQAKTKKITEKEINYLAKYHLSIADMNFCSDTKVYSIGEWAINRVRQSLGKDEICFGYNLVNERGNWLKIMRPERDKKEKWRSSIPFFESHGVGNINNCEIGILTKSLKDGAFINKYLIPNVEVIQAEDFSAIDEDSMMRIKENCKELYIVFDSDPTGVSACQALTQEFDCKYINPPKELLNKGISDFTDWASKTDVQTVVDFWKFKNVIE